MSANYEKLPENLPVPEDDGACDHLMGVNLPDIELPSTRGGMVNPARVAGKVVIFCYPMTGKPGVALPEGWDDIPGARGCTPQNCAFRDSSAEIRELGAEIFGLSTQDRDYQQEMAERLHLPFPVLSDIEMEFSSALRLPLFSVDGMDLLKRVTIIAGNGVIEAVHYPVFPSNSDPAWVLKHLRTRG
ncbi:peroxiredoxin [Alphaproteobacteria bacterium LSUCC0684]